ncbi:uncharacterized protein Z520_09253 [Fonsecaea multimorphosa CBS 102226]|uniref:Uncharacterized protein n=1 Tax=Fonsecaea multimorphosa CBS 102226 TaxID=1442371 RepID=A0A0D2KE34_9EURO|nr:uncharacterized protein Z520_09253 [Fonsecaea multimorphosa CBS 102226]KIX94943.1 hypothetical protein Z520_09253 [Fonsecaea multimorphosa CBS 102226]
MSSEKQEASTKGESRKGILGKGTAGTFLHRFRPWKPKCARNSVQAKLLTGPSPSESEVNSSPNISFGPVQHYGQVSYLHPGQYASNTGFTRAFKGHISTTIHGVETIMPTHEYLSHPQETRSTILNPHLRLDSGYYPHPISPPPDAPPPPPPIDITTGKPFKSESSKACSEAGAAEKKCPQCHHASTPALTDGVWISLLVRVG